MTNKNTYKIDPDVIYTVQETADILRVSTYTIRRLIKEGRLKASIHGRSYTTYGAHIEDFVKAEFKMRPVV